ncbi:MAG: nitroreductase family protein [Deltaproteobacteria bacterium]|nr:nitroreductase family protein [Deltaproteobacteria bacterium]
MGDGAFLALARNRHSVRGYFPDPVPEEKLERCLEAARLAPSACNSQPWTFIVVDDPELKGLLADLTSERLLPLNHFVKQAPVLIVIVVEPANLTSRLGSWIKNRDFPLIDIGIAAEHFCLQAVEEGLGTCMIGWFREAEVKELLGVPAAKRIGLLIALGYPQFDAAPTKHRKPLEETVCHNRYRLQPGKDV